MAIVTYPVASFANGLVRAEIDLNDVNLRLMKGRVINGSPFPAYFQVYKAGALVGDLTVLANTTQERNLPASVQFSMDAGDPVWGMPPEMTMGDIQIGCRWPG